MAVQRADQTPEGFDGYVERKLGADMRLVYGIGVPILIITGLICVVALQPAVWLVASVLVIELGLVALVIYAFSKMLGEPADDELDPAVGPR